MTSAAVTHTLATPQIMAANFLNLLIVDDERSIRDACREVALSLGFIAHVADSAEHAYRLLQTQNIDAILLDLRLPGAGGLEALRYIKAQRPEALVIVVTGYGTVQSAVQAMKHGAYEYVTKPFSIDELKLLLQRVSNHLKLKTENRICARSSNPSRATAASWAALRRWRSSTASLPKPPTAPTQC
jgi:DNA-binding NtrC family response regulator